MREQFVKSGEWKLTSSKIEKSIEEFNKYHTRKPRWNLEYPLDGYQCFFLWTTRFTLQSAIQHTLSLHFAFYYVVSLLSTWSMSLYHAFKLYFWVRESCQNLRFTMH